MMMTLKQVLMFRQFGLLGLGRPAPSHVVCLVEKVLCIFFLVIIIRLLIYTSSSPPPHCHRQNQCKVCVLGPLLAREVPSNRCLLQTVLPPALLFLVGSVIVIIITI